MPSPALYLATRPLPVVPSTTLTYKSTQTTTTNEDTTTFTGVDIGTPHPKRIVIIAGMCGVNAAVSATCNGIPHYHLTQQAARQFAVLAFQVPNSTTASLAITSVSSARKAFSVYVAYPADHTVLDFGTDNRAGTTDATVTNLKAMNGGFIVYAGGQTATLGTFTTTWGGTDAVTEDVDAQLEAVSSYTTGRINITVSSDTLTVTLAESVSGSKDLACCSWGKAYGT